MTPCIREIDLETGVPTGLVYYFCSNVCQHHFSVPAGTGTCRYGDSDDCVDGNVCDQCGSRLDHRDEKHQASLIFTFGGTVCGVGFAIVYFSQHRYELAFWAAFAGCWAFDCLVREIGGRKS